MLNITIYCFKKKSEINVCFLLNTYPFSTLKFNSLIDLIIASPNLEAVLFPCRQDIFWHSGKGSNILMGSSFLQFFECLILYFV